MADTKYTMTTLCGKPCYVIPCDEFDSMKATPQADAALADAIKRACAYYQQAGRVGSTAPMLAKQHEATADKIISAALRARAVPEGFVMVPAKPTSDQLIAGAKTMFRSHGTQNGVVGEVYRAMLAASKADTGGAK